MGELQKAPVSLIILIINNSHLNNKMRFALFATAIAVASGLRSAATTDRGLGEEAAGAAAAFKEYNDATSAVMTSQGVYMAALAHAKTEENKLKNLITGVQAQERVVEAANADADTARQGVLDALTHMNDAFKRY